MVLLSVLLAGCTSFEPFDEQEHYFSVYGWLDMRKDVQMVRVLPVRQTPALPAHLSARVLVRDEITGEEHRWKDSLVAGLPSVFLFYRRFTPQPGHRYRILVRDSLERTTTLETFLPSVPEIRPDSSWREDARGRIVQEVTMVHPDGVFEAATMRYRVSLFPDDSPTEIVVTYPNLRWEEAPGHTRLGITWELDRRLVEERMGVADSTRLWLHRAELILTLVDPEWEQYRATETLPSSTRQGFGVVAGVTQYDTLFLPSPAVADSLNYVLIRAEAYSKQGFFR